MSISKLEIAREGGLAHFPGLAKPVAVDLSSWPVEMIAALEALFSSAPHARPKASQPDRQIYRCTFDTAAASATVYIDPICLNGAQAELFAQLVADWRSALGPGG